MRRRLVVVPEAEEELLAASAWYERERRGLGLEFIAALEDAFTAIQRSPEAHARWSDNATFRKRSVGRFPFIVFFEVAPDVIKVAAVAHAKRRPGYWVGRD